MGVIKKSADCSFGITSSISEETLYIPSSDREHSRSQSVENLTRFNFRSRTRVPTVGRSNFSTLSSNAGKKKSRRFENVCQLLTLREEDESDEVSIDDFYVKTKTPFTVLLEDEECYQKWDEFVSSSEEHQTNIIFDKKRVCSCPQKNKKLTNALRNLLRKKNLPLGMLKYLEDELVKFFSSMPTEIYVSPVLSSFERLLLHSLSDYHSLISLSYDSEPNKLRLVRVSNPKDIFPLPELLLVQYLEQKYNKFN